ncbi:hypothetical protein AB0J81_04510 [Streptomyces bobili]|uniref:hypothetical protein n=1 Tax=Streptomyces bobili TaxID=67280 RepID=UPI003428789B
MKKLLSSRPALWFLFLFYLSPSPCHGPLRHRGLQGVMTAAGTGVVSLGAGVSLVRDRGGNAATR